MKKNVLIIGGGKGLGYELCKLYDKFHNTLATYRRHLPPIQKRNTFYLDLKTVNSADPLINWIISKKITLDYVLFIAGQTPNQKINRKNCFFGEGLSKNLFKNYLTINCFSHTLLCEGLLYNNVLNNNCKIVFFSSLAGSINLRGKLKHQKFGGNIFYRISKSALNSAVKNISYELTPSSKIVVSLHPGWVKTDSGEEVADLEVGVAARNIKKLISNINKKDHGKFLNYNGRTLKW
tara:strand:+ start:42 stop:749 length:708 start_codon:yes stop_codon:yes gene_type:complete